MKRYLVFGGDTYYPGGGWDDYLGTFDDLEEARKYAIASKNSWWDVVDTTTLTKVSKYA